MSIRPLGLVQLALLLFSVVMASKFQTMLNVIMSNVFKQSVTLISRLSGLLLDYCLLLDKFIWYHIEIK